MPDYYIPWSEREGLSEVRTQIQDSGMDGPLRIDLWNAFYETIAGGGHTRFLRMLWKSVLRHPADQFTTSNCMDAVKSVIVQGDWRLACDVVVYTAEELSEVLSTPFIALANAAFDRGQFAWRFSGRRLIRRMGKAEIKALEVGLQDAQPFPEVWKQLDTALQEFSSREHPNYGHAAKEGISAVETLCRKMLGKPSITLGAALKKIRKSGKPRVDPALLSSFEKLYGYASDKGYVRHGGKPDDLTDVTMEEAQLLLVTSSAIVSFLVARADREGMLE